MAIAATTVWEIRPGATASCVNGGGFNPSNATPGTDYSQQDAAQYTYTNLASTSGTTNPSVVTSASHSFDANDCGNIIHITAGTSWTAGWYEIVSVSGGAATLDRACGSSATLSNGTFYVGGALSWGTNTATAINAGAGGNVWWMKSGSYSQSASISTSITGSATAQVSLIGYNATRGDNPTGSNRPLVTHTGGSNLGFVTAASSYWCIRNISMFVSSGTTQIFAPGGFGYAYNCKFENSIATASNYAITTTSAPFSIINCEVVCYRGIAINVGTGEFSVIGCYIHDSDIGISSTASSKAQVVANNLFVGCVTYGIRYANSKTVPSFITGNTIYGAENKLGIGISFAASVYNSIVINNIIYGCTTGIDHGTSGCIATYTMFNSINNCTTDRTNAPAGIGDITTAPAFTTMATVTGTAGTTASSILTDGSADFSNVTDNVDYCYLSAGTGITVGVYLITAHSSTTVTLSPAPGNNATADKVYRVTTGRNLGIGTALQGLGIPAAFQTIGTTSYMDIGAVQRRIDVPAITDVRHGTAYDNSSKTGTAYIPVASDVRYGVNIDATTGTCVVPTAGNTKTGVSVDVAGTGTYDGSDRWTDPGVSHVELGVSYKANSLTNNKTGTLTSTSTDPGIANVRSGTGYQISGSSLTGTLDLPTAANVKTGITFDGASKTGTYDGSDRWTDLDVSLVHLGTSYKANSTTNNKTGTLDISTPAEIAAAVWGEPKSGYTTAGTFGKYLDAQVSTVGGGSAPSAATIAAAVWDESTSGYTDSTKFGGFVRKILTLAQYIGLK